MKPKNLLLALLAQLLTLSASAYDVYINGIYYNRLSPTELEVTRGEGQCYSGSVVIPSTVTYEGRTFKVVKIGDEAFRWLFSLESVTIPEGVTEIGSNAFWNANKMNNVVLPNSLVTIGESAFNTCIGLSSIYLPNNLKSLKKGAFWNCQCLKYIFIPESVTEIGDGAFYNCHGLQMAEFASIESLCSIKYGEGETQPRADSNPLYWAHHLYIDGEEVNDLVIPKSVTHIGPCTFAGCTALNSVTVEKGNPVYDSRGNCNAIIENQSNRLVFGIDKTVIPDGIKEIGKFAFVGQTGLTTLKFPDSVTKIDTCAYAGCTSIITMYVRSKTPPQIYGDDAGTFDESLYSAWTDIYVPMKSKTRYQNANYWKKFKYIYEYDYDLEDGIHDTQMPLEIESQCDISGRQLDKPQKGINIIRYSDGTTRKVLVK